MDKYQQGDGVNPSQHNPKLFLNYTSSKSNKSDMRLYTTYEIMPRAKTTKKATAAAAVVDAVPLNGLAQPGLKNDAPPSPPPLPPIPAVKGAKGGSKKTTASSEEAAVAADVPGGGRVRKNPIATTMNPEPEKKGRGARKERPAIVGALVEEVATTIAAKPKGRNKKAIVDSAAAMKSPKGTQKKAADDVVTASKSTDNVKLSSVKKRGNNKVVASEENKEQKAPVGRSKKAIKVGDKKEQQLPLTDDQKQQSISTVAESSPKVAKKRGKGKVDGLILEQQHKDEVNGINMDELPQPSPKKKPKKDAAKAKPPATAAVVEKPKRGKTKMADAPAASPKIKKLKTEDHQNSDEQPAAATSRARKATVKTSGAAAGPIEQKVPRKRAAKSNAVYADADNSDDDEEPKPSAPKRAAKGAAPLNPVKSVYHKADFELAALREGEEATADGVDRSFNLKIASWNVAGLRSWVKKDGLAYLDYEEPDIFCLQEIKCTVDQLPPEAERITGYHPYWLCMPGGYAGVAIYSKIMPINVEYGIGEEEFDTVGRLITAEYEKFFLINVYVPNAGRKLVNLEARMRWEQHFRDFVRELDARKPVIICGDMNVSHAEIDLANPKANARNAGFTKEEREQMSALLDAGFVDSFRHLYPTRKAAYTFWTYMGNARKRNVGWRLDYFLVSQRFMQRVVENAIRDQCLGSDHCPITLFLKI